jgi:signal transduction histidine kinase
MGTPLAGAAGAFDAVLCAELARLGARLEPRLLALDRDFRRNARARGYGVLEVRALCAVAPGEALRFFAAGRPPQEFFEQVEYNGRRLAKLNLPPQEVQDALAAYELPGAEAFQGALEGLRLGVALELNAAYYQVREAETQAFYGLFRAEVEAAGLDELLRRSMEILTRALRAQAGRLVLVEGATLTPGLLARLARPVYIECGARNEFLILDEDWRGRYPSCWSVPFRDAGRVEAVAQFGFPKRYGWLPRELTLLEAAAERCMAAVRRARLLRDLAARQEQVRLLAAHVVRAGDEERRRISRELHDEAGQGLLLVRLELEKLEKAAPAETRDALRQARELTERSIDEVRRAVAALSPAVLERLGFEAALRQLCARFAKSYPGKVRLRLPSAFPEVPGEAAAALYRVAQECCQNAARHSGASRINLSLRSADGVLEFSVSDNGAGFDVPAALAKPDSFGLAGMRERVALLGGEFEVRSRPGRGTVATARLPLRPAALAARV